MKQYIFFLGRDEELAFLEIVSYLKARNFNYNVKKLDKSSLLLAVDKFDPKTAIDRLGGTVKIAEECVFDDLRISFKNKMKYVVTGFNPDKVNSFLKELKMLFKEEKIKAMRKKFNLRQPSKDMSMDLEVLLYKDKIFKTVAISNPKLYKQRDEKRPEFSGKEVISIRLAKMLINICGLKENDILLDPFCGIGTVMQEGLLMRMNVIGFDKDRKTIDSASKNLKWLGNEYEKKWKLFNVDNSNLCKFVKKVEGVVTEPYMGPYVTKIMKKEDAVKVVKELNLIYSSLLKNLRKVVRGKVVIVVPSFKTREGGNVETSFYEDAKDAGFKMARVEKVELPVYYYKKRSKIERYIYVLE
jgi:tRNA G10  N-methylase Trm11